MVEALAHLRHSAEDVHQESVVRLLVEDVLLRVVVGVKLLFDELKDLRHELQLVEFVKGGQKAEHQLDEAINETVVECVVIEATLARSRAECKFDAFLDHHIAESEQDFVVLVDAQLTQLVEVLVHLFLCRRVIDLREFDPLDVEFAEVFLLLGRDQASELVECVSSGYRLGIIVVCLFHGF